MPTPPRERIGRCAQLFQQIRGIPPASLDPRLVATIAERSARSAFWCRSSRSAAAENQAVPRARTHRPMTVSAGAAAVDVIAPGSRSASMAWTPKRNNNVFHSAILSPVRYEHRRVTPTTWTASRKQSGLAAPPVSATWPRGKIPSRSRPPWSAGIAIRRLRPGQRASRSRRRGRRGSRRRATSPTPSPWRAEIVIAATTTAPSPSLNAAKCLARSTIDSSSEGRLDGLAPAHRMAMVSRTGRRRTAGERGRAVGPSCRAGPGQDEADRGEQEHQDDRQALGRSGGRAATRSGSPGCSPTGRLAGTIDAPGELPNRVPSAIGAWRPIRAQLSRERQPSGARFRPGEPGRSRGRPGPSAGSPPPSPVPPSAGGSF